MKVIKFTAVWCPACIIMNNRWDKIVKECDWVECESYDYDQAVEAVGKYNIGRDIPVFIFLDKSGAEILRLQGEIDRKELVKLLEEHREK